MTDDAITKRGRPSKATPQKLKELVAVVRAIGFKSTTARKCGLNPDTLDNWLDKGEDGEEPFGEWRTEFLSAQAEWEAEQIDRASAQDPRWVLERQNPRVYGKPDPAAVSVNVSQTQVGITPADLERSRAQLLEDLRRDPLYLSKLEADIGEIEDGDG